MPSKELIDTHQHLWVPSERAYSWITPEFGPLYDDFTPERLAPEIPESGVTGSVLVQAADTYEDTFYMLDIAARYPLVQGLVGWIPFDRTDEARAALDIFTKNRYFKGVRNLTHDYSNPKYGSDDQWILRPEVLETLSLVEHAGLSLDYIAVNSAHIENVAVLARNFPTLKIVVDHFAKPDIANQEMEPWASLMAVAAESPNVYAKLSGLNTASAANWTYADWQPYVDHIVNVYGAERVMMGGDWPVAILAGTYTSVWKAQLEVIAKYSEDQQEWLRHKTAKKFYNL
ncbi:MAG: amidohydrolase family protein [Actinobacteria bacterium]|nr:amidohydrolase family protein [Actinomycetota bacterium]